jgi:hypothetical protein
MMPESKVGAEKFRHDPVKAHSFVTIDLGHTGEFDIAYFKDWIVEQIEETGFDGDRKFEPLFTFEIFSMKHCAICLNLIHVEDLTRVMTLDGEDVNQPLVPIKVCPSCMQTEVDAPGWGFANCYNSMDQYEQVVNTEDYDEPTLEWVRKKKE